MGIRTARPGELQSGLAANLAKKKPQAGKNEKENERDDQISHLEDRAYLVSPESESGGDDHAHPKCSDQKRP
jgi:hypothetical protein